MFIPNLYLSSSPANTSFSSGICFQHGLQYSPQSNDNDCTCTEQQNISLDIQRAKRLRVRIEVITFMFIRKVVLQRYSTFLVGRS